MKLSDAIMMGSMLGRMESSDINTCALGVAATAVGIPLQKALVIPDVIDRYRAIADRWPWLSSNNSEKMNDIMELFDNNVSTGHMTLDQLVDHVRSIEPPCGECCSFDCCCERGARVEEELLAKSSGVLSEARV